MNKPFKITLYDKGKRASFYSVHFDGEEIYEFDKFLSDPEIKANPHFSELIAQMNDILERYGCQERLFKKLVKTPQDIV